ncbi:MAG: IS66 family transposase [Ktedonobacteraceae bacterium]
MHFLRAAHGLKEQYPHDEPLVTWAEQGPDPISHRASSRRGLAQQHAFEQQLLAVCRPCVGIARSVATAAAHHTLCERVERFLPELFVFVAVPGVPAHNNLAERSIRPLVVARKISGGRAALKAPRRVWDSSVSSALGPHNISILSSTVWLFSLANLPQVKV